MAILSLTFVMVKWFYNHFRSIHSFRFTSFDQLLDCQHRLDLLKGVNIYEINYFR